MVGAEERESFWFLFFLCVTYSSFGSMSMHVQCRHRNPAERSTRVDLRMRTNNESRRAMRVERMWSPSLILFLSVSIYGKLIDLVISAVRVIVSLRVL